ncbi:MAG: hypothetical protein Q7S60_04305 [bacterium]|nr:hypothetical protein [bacterium]
MVILVGLGTAVVLWKQGNQTPAQPVNQQADNVSEDMTAIRSFMANPNLELIFVNTDLPMPYFRVGKVTKVDDGENMEAVDSWVRKVNVYDQKEIVNEQCSIYEYHTDTRNHTLTAVLIRGLRSSEIDTLKENGITCISDSGNMPKISKAEAETMAMEYLKRAVPNFDQIKDRFAYTQQRNGESHEWIWEDKGYKLPEGLSSRPYSYPIVRIAVYGNREIQYWNTVSLFQN